MNRDTTDIERLLEHRALVEGLARRLVLDAAQADDVVQETWLAALASAPRDPGKARAWLAAVVRNVAATFAVGEQRRARRERSAAVAERAPAVDGAVEAESARRALVDAVFKLAEPWRTAIVLRHLEGLSRREIARRTAAPLETVRTRLRRALDLLRDDLDRRDGGRKAWCIPLIPLAVRAHLAARAAGFTIGAAAVAGAALIVAGVTLAHAGSGASDRAARAPADHVVEKRSIAPAPAEIPTAAPRREVVHGEPPVPANRASPRSAGRNAPAPPASPELGALEVRVKFGSDGAPAPAIGLLACCLGDRDPWFAPRRAFTDAAGTARFDAIAPGEVDVFVDRGSLALAGVRAGESALTEITLDGGEDLAGRVVDEHGVPVEGAEVYLTLVGTSGDGLEHAESAEVARSGPGGAFAVRSVAAGRGIAARAPGRAPSAVTWIEKTASPRRPLVLELRGAGGAIVGRVADAAGAPVASARVTVDPNTTRVSSAPTAAQPAVEWARACDLDGRFAFAGVAPGAHLVVVRAPGRAAWSRTIEVAEGAAAVIDARLDAGGIVAGRVVDASGAPVLGARVVAGRRAGADTSFDWTAADGSFRLEHLAVGDIRIAVKGGARGSADLPIATVAGVEAHVEVRLDPPATLRIRVLDPADRPCGGVHVTAIARAANGSVLLDRQGTCAEDGVFSLPGCPAGDVLVRCKWDPFAEEGATVCVVRARVEEQVLHMPPDPRAAPRRGGGVIRVGAGPANQGAHRDG